MNEKRGYFFELFMVELKKISIKAGFSKSFMNPRVVHG